MAGGIQIKGVEKLLKKLQKLEKVTAKAAAKKATRAGNKVLLAAERAEIPVDTGQLKRDETSKLQTKGLSVTGIIGADQGKLNTQHSENHKRPSNIDWLVEYGHVTPDGVFVPPSGSFRRAAAQAMPEAEATYARVLKQEIEAAV